MLKLTHPCLTKELNAIGGHPAQVSPIHPGQANNNHSKKHVFSDDHGDDKNLPHYPNKRPRTQTASLHFDDEPDNSKIEFQVTTSKIGQKGGKGARGA